MRPARAGENAQRFKDLTTLGGLLQAKAPPIYSKVFAGLPFRVEHARLVLALVGMRPKEVALSLGQVLRQIGSSVAVKIGN